VRLSVGEDLVDVLAQGSAVCLQFGMYQPDASKRHDGTLQRLVRLKSYNLFNFLVDVSILVAGDGGNGFFVDIVHAAALAFDGEQVLEFVPQVQGALGRPLQEGCVSIIGSVVIYNESSCVDFVRAVFSIVHDVSSFTEFPYTFLVFDIPCPLCLYCD